MQGGEQVTKGYRLSPQQMRVWRLQQESQAFKSQCAILIEGELESRALEESLKKIMRKHEILRTTLDWLSGQDMPIQFTIENPSLPLRKVDLSHEKPEDLEAEVAGLLKEESRPFDLKRGLLARFCLGRLSARKQVLLITLHSLCADSRTLKNLFKETTRYYAAELERVEISDEPAQYLQFSEWQNELLEGENENTSSQGQVVNCPIPDLALPLESGDVGRPKPARRRFFPEAVALTLDSRITGRIEAISNSHSSSAYDFLLACWQILLWRLSAEEEIIVERLFDGRQFGELHDALGLFARYLPACGTLGRGLRFDEALKRAMGSQRRAYAAQESFLRDMTSGKVTDRAHAICFEYEEWPKAGHVGSAKFSYWKQYVCVDRFKLKLVVYRKADGLTIEVQYDSSVFSQEGMEIILERYLTLIESAVMNERALIGDLKIIGRKELERQLVEWNETEKWFPDNGCIHELITEQSRLRPESIAIIYGEEKLSYGDLERRANQLANHLRSLGVGPDCIVGLYLERSTEMMIGLLGILKAGGAYLPLDVGQPAERLEGILEDSGARVVVTKQGVGYLPAGRREVVRLDEDWERIADCSGEAPEVKVGLENLAYVIYTSGSTGKPKGVLIRHHGLANSTLARFHYYSEPVLSFILVPSFSFDSSVAVIYWTLCQGGTLVLPYERLERDPARLARLIAESHASHLLCLPTLYSLLLTDTESGQMGSLKCVIVAGEACPPEVIERHSELLAGVRLFNEYGPTEGTVWSSVYGDCSKLPRARATAPIGKPIANTQMYILDEELEPAPIGVKGEIYVSGAGLARGYLGNPGLTAERFIPNQFSGKCGEKLYRTGDVGRHQTGGNIEFVGRTDGQVKLRGYRIELGEIEAALKEHGSVRESAVITREDEKGDRRLVGYVVGERGVAAAELKRHLRERLPDYMIPEAVLVLESMPVTTSGKIDRKRLPALSDVRQSIEERFVAPRDVLEFQLAQIWESVLGVRPIGVRDNFFDLGGHSLLAPSLMARIQAVTGRDLPLSALFQGRTIEHLAAILRGEASSMSWSCLVGLQPFGPQPPLFFAHPGGGNVLCYLELAHRLGADQPFYGLQAAGFYGERALYTRIEDMASHYIEALRTVQAEGPFFLGGWSLGGIVAYEMAQQLTAQGEKVSQLLLLDTSAWTSGEGGVEEEQIEQDDAVLLMNMFSEALPISREDLDPFQGDERLDYVLRQAIEAGLLPPGIEVARARFFLEMYSTNARAMSKYIPQAYPGAVTLFKAAIQPPMPPLDGSERCERLTKMSQDPTMGWGKLAAGGVRIIDVPGTHTTMIRKPHVESLAVLMRTCLGPAETAALQATSGRRETLSRASIQPEHSVKN
jgi:amino acid adenylation domain-containing protein